MRTARRDAATIILGANPARGLDMPTGALLLIALAALVGPEFSFHPYLAYPTAAIALAFLQRRLSSVVRLLALVVAATCAVRATRTLQQFTSERAQVRQSLGASTRCAGEAVVVRSPVLREGSFVAVVDALQLDCEGRAFGSHRLRLSNVQETLRRGDRIEFVAQLGPIASAQNIELMNPIPRLASSRVVASGGVLTLTRVAAGTGFFAAVDRARNSVRQRILATYAPRARGLARALVLGENDLDPEEQLAFQRSGLSHLLAVSGTHLVLAVVSVVRGLRAVLLRFPRIAARCEAGRIAAALGALLALLYADFAGGSGSAWRAAWMLAALYLASVLDRKLAGLRALALSVVIGVAFDPFALYDVSFVLSALATSGLVVLGPILRRPARQVPSRPLAWIVEALSTTCSAMVPCTPLLLLLAPELTLAGLAANVVAGPFGELAALPLCLGHALAAPLPWLEQGLALAGSGALLTVGWIAAKAAAISWARIALPPPTVEQLDLLLITALVWISLPSVGSSRIQGSARPQRHPGLFLACGAVLGWLALEWAAQRAGAPHQRLRITAVDVGQGDALLIDLPDGRLMLVDGGGAVTGGLDPGTRVLLPLLRARRRDRVDIAVLSHPHPDHYGGFLSVLRQIRLLEFWEAGPLESQSEGELAGLRRDLVRRGTLVRHLPELCRTFPVKAGAPIQVLGPCPNVEATPNANDQSIVLRLEWGQHSAVLPGDAEAREETDLLARYGNRLHADLLKLGHHGSRTSSSTAWLDAVHPSTAMISVGIRNRFGHPHPSTLAHLAARHINAYRTDQLGAIEWSTDGIAASIRSASTCCSEEAH